MDFPLVGNICVKQAKFGMSQSSTTPRGRATEAFCDSDFFAAFKQEDCSTSLVSSSELSRLTATVTSKQSDDDRSRMFWVTPAGQLHML